MAQVHELLLAEFNALNLGSIASFNTINHGLSQYCFDVVTEHSQQYIVKLYVNGVTATLPELQAYQAFRNDFIPELIADSKHLIVLEKLSGQLLTTADFALHHKVSLALSGAKKLHQLTITPELSFCRALNFSAILTSLIQPLTQQQTLFNLLNSAIGQQLQTLNDYLNNKIVKPVLCHGDLNFGNVFFDAIDDNLAVKLIDFESLCLMPREYDVAMLFAVNNIDIVALDHLFEPAWLTDDVAEHLTEQFVETTSQLDKQLIQCYYRISLLINGIWYLNRYNSYQVERIETQKLQLAPASVNNIDKPINKAERYYTKAYEQFCLYNNAALFNAIFLKN
ncbi:MAG: phosphotransferase family protein [Thalassotalea sp.]